jgi:hypothetical protein
VQGKKLAVDGAATPRFVGLAPCDAGADKGYNGVSSASLRWDTRSSKVNSTAVLFVNRETNRCLAMGEYKGQTNANASLTPLLLPCNASDPAQAWFLPNPLATATIGGLLWLPATLTGKAAAFTAGDSTIYSAVHGEDRPLPDSFYGLNNLTLSEYAPEAPCTSRACDDYSPGQMWYYSPRLRTLNLGLMSANHYHCWGPNCQHLTSHLPTSAQVRQRVR